MSHDPGRHLTYLQQALESDKRPLALLLGAGCPLSVKIATAQGPEPLIPDLAGLMRLTDASVLGTGDQVPYDLLKAHFSEDGLPTPNIETLLSHIRSLRAVVGASSIRGLKAAELDSVENRITSAVVLAANKPLPSSDTPYHRLAAWVAGVPRHDPIEIFTTNYDLLTEQALEETRTPSFDGFVGSREPFFDVAAMEDDVLPARWARLWKIHGSINWSLSGAGNVVRTGIGSGQHLIYPSHLKYEQSRRMPYLAMLDRLKTFLRRPSAVLVTDGYSFGDEHVNEAIVQGLQGNPSAITFGLMYGTLADYPQASQLAERRVNLTVLARDSAIVATRADTYSVPSGRAISGLVVQPATEATPEQCEIRLGDFMVFAEFLRLLVGEKSLPAAL